jgi:hypothetical protein
MKTEMSIFYNNNKIKVIEDLMLVILNCILLHDQNDGWTVPYPYLMVCCKNIYLKCYVKMPTLLDKNCYMTLEHFY